ncbi:hypothetical protein C7974DRAFT_211752 [Boeremia exigua]|uniref:uncharacterized protein n=1 Tax=Boeremia exigua TaxID=749465 RepID=UPI001E8D18D5|nr:uncharacterized protein C7974DRAFT_211752 [Boeremia exigua]KAH6621829.1 hypothetical protein C7974DRAFT_211752 [Boeremia exigua]
MPDEIRSMIYGYLVTERSIEHCNKNDHTRVRSLTDVSRVCQTLRDEYLPYLLARVEFRTNLDWMPHFVSIFGKALHGYQSSLILSYDPATVHKSVNLLPALKLAVETPHLSLRFELPAAMHEHYPLDIMLIRDLNYLLTMCGANQTFAGYVGDGVLLSVEFHSKEHLSQRYTFSQMAMRVQIRFKRDYKKLWMDGTHSFDELQHFLSLTGLNQCTSFDVWVGIASMCARGKGLCTPTETQEVERLLNRYCEFSREGV